MRLTAARLKAYCDKTYSRTAAGRVRTSDAALDFVNARGYVYFWPIKGVELPSLWVATAGDRPVASEHSDPGHMTWGWKDNWLGEKKLFYAKVLRGKATLISLRVLPYFYALSENYGDVYDYRLQYEAGQMTAEARQIYEALLEKGRLDTLALRREARLTGKDSNTRFERALVDLQRDFKVLPVGVAQAGAWKYAFVYELVGRWYPDLAAQARSIGRGEARACLAELYLESVGAVTGAQITKLFGWRADETHRALDKLAALGRAALVDEINTVPGPWWVTSKLLAIK
jgi:hypothetical protein